MTALYICADKVGTPTGGGQVTFYELEALKQLGEEVLPISVDHSKPMSDPFSQDLEILEKVKEYKDAGYDLKLAHCYAGCLDETVRYLHSINCKVTYTVAAHDVSVSREEHERLLGDFPYPHLKDPDLFGKYINGYLQADTVIVPSTHSEKTVRSQGRTKPVKVIPHGHVPYTGDLQPYPKTFTLGYLGAIGPDKGLYYLLQAWKLLNYRDAILVFAGRWMDTPMMQEMIYQWGGGNIVVKGWQDSVSDFYNSLSAFVVPSASEGFNIEVLEAMSHGRPVVCSYGAGAVDLVPLDWRVQARSIQDLMSGIDHARRVCHLIGEDQKEFQNRWRRISDDYVWDSVYPLYHKVWRQYL